jgi:hypothetical protein
MKAANGALKIQIVQITFSIWGMIPFPFPHKEPTPSFLATGYQGVPLAINLKNNLELTDKM